MAATAISRDETQAVDEASRSSRLRRRLAELSLLQRLFVFEILVFIIAFLGVFSMVEWYADSLEKRIDSERFSLARAFVGELDHLLDHGFAELTAATVMVADGQDFSAALERLSREDLFSGGVVLLDANDLVTNSDSRHRALIGRHLSRVTTPVRTSGGSGEAWGISLEDRTTYVAMSADGGPGTNQRLVGLISADSGIIADTFVRAVAISDTGHAELVDTQALALFTTEPGHHLRTSDHPSFYTRRDAESLPPGTYRVDHEEEGDAGRHAMAFVPLRRLPLVFAVGGTEQDTYAPVGTLWNAFYFLTAIAGVSAIAATLTGAPRLTRPVRELRDAAQRVAAGSLETPIAVRSGGEIGELARSVETMRRSLYDWGRTLDQRVIERTEEIEGRNLELATSSEVARIVGSTFDMETMLRLTTNYIERAFDADGVVVNLPARGRRAAVRASSSRMGGAGSVAYCEACLAGKVDFRKATLDEIHSSRCLGDGEVWIETFPIDSQTPDPGNRSGSLCLIFSEGHKSHRPASTTLGLLVSSLSFGVRNSDLYHDVRDREAQAHLLVGKVLTAQEEERQRVARELHDDAGQALATLMFGIDALDQAGPDRGAERADQLVALRTITKEAIDSLRRTIFALRPPALDDLGLEAAIARYADIHARPAGVNVSISGKVDVHRLGPNGEVALFRVIQESLNNVVRHSGATAAQISFRQFADGTIEVHVRDNGRGFDPGAARRSGAVGIYGMAERAEMLGGHLDVVSSPGEGTVVVVVFPAIRDLQDEPR